MKPSYGGDIHARIKDQGSRIKSFLWLGPVILIASLMGLSACGGGSSGGGAPSATISGQVVDKLLPGAKVSLFSSGLSGTPLGTATADSNGNYHITFTPPSGSTPLFLAAVSSGNYLGSYIGPANTFSGTVSSSTAPNLNITQVTTATLAVAQNQGISLSAMTPTNYGQQVINLENVIIQLAAVVQGVVDNGCTISGGLTPSNLSSLMGSSLTSATNVITNLVGQLSSCSTTTTASTLNTFASQIPASQTIAPQLTSTSASNSTAPSIPAGTYSGILTPIVTYNTSSCPSGTPTPFTATMTVTSSGSISFSTSGNNGSATGTLTGSNFTMSGSTPGGSLSASGAFVPLASGTVSGGSGFSVNGGWTITCSNGGSYGGTYNIPDLLTSGASLTATPSSISNGTYAVSGFSYNNIGSCSGTGNINGTITISGSSITFTSSTGSGTGSGTLAGNTFTMNVTPGSGGGNISVTGAINSQSSTTLSISGSFQESGNTYCTGTESGTFSLST